MKKGRSNWGVSLLEVTGGLAGATTFGAAACGGGRACSGGDTACVTGAAGANGAVKGLADAIAAGNIARSVVVNVGVLLVCLICRLKHLEIVVGVRERAGERGRGRGTEWKRERLPRRICTG